MIDAVFVTGNQHKAKYFSEIVGYDIKSMKVDVDEIQSLDIAEVVGHKARQAFEYAQRPVIVEDTKLSFNALGSLPGTYIKWFQQEIGDEGLCTLLDSYKDRSAVAGAAIAYFDGRNLKIFEKELLGEIVAKPTGNSGFGWNKVFKPEGADCTLGEMDEEEFVKWYMRIKPFAEIRKFLKTID